MKTRLITQNHWSVLSDAIRKAGTPCQVAVAYLGQGGAEMLSLPAGSCLAVDASEACVKQGMTCPGELIRLHESGVEVYSVANLHAKVYVTGREVFVGSANVSGRSAQTLVEALLHTVEPRAVAEAREFIRSLCVCRMGIKQLKRLDGIYRPPKASGITAASGGRRTNGKEVPGVPELRVARIRADAPWPDEEEPLRNKGKLAADKALQFNDGSHCMELFRWTGACPFEPGQWVIQVLKEVDREWVYPPGYVVHVEKSRKNSAVYVHLEMPVKRRRNLERVLASDGEAAVLSRTGLVKNPALVRKLFEIWKK